jgi:aminodeoxyfutalosine deaminase
LKLEVVPPLPSRTEEFIARLPKVELHVHLEGSLSPETFRELCRSHGTGESQVVAWLEDIRRRKFRYGNFQEFIDAYKFVARHLDSPADYAFAAERLVEDLARQNVLYAEVMFSAGVLLWKDQRIAPVFEAAAHAAAEACAARGIRINWIFDAVRHFGAEPAREVLRVASRYRDSGVVAFGIGGDERRGPAELFGDLYREARDLGLHTTAHAGETAGPESVRASVELLGAERIGHGLAAAQDPAVLALLRERGVPLEVCLTSNVATGALAEVSEHPLPQFLGEGVRVTLNSDDPGLFGTTLEQEFMLAARTFGLSREQLTAFTENAIDAAFLAEQEKAQLRKAL